MSSAICLRDQPAASRSAILSAHVFMAPNLQDSVEPSQQHPVTEFCNHFGMVKTIGDRIREERTAQGIERGELAARIKMGYSTLAEIERGGMKSSTKLHTIAAALGVSPGWLETGKGPKEPAANEPDWADVPFFVQAAGLGNGAEAEEYAETHKLKFKASSMRRKGLHPGKLAVFYGRGDSMLPRIKSGDAILFDTSDTKIRDGVVYMILVPSLGAKDEYQVKRAMVLDDAVYFVADNPEGDHNWKKPRRADSRKDPVHVVGRVRWIGSWED
jgi:phage repressor protein C with HTH and peptisase S24 domain